ncbi:MAG: hypothetical protein JEZ00_15230 [Anaerolineaceae bacterium]|nr:hypothetical protein [Anaerolineaceae bacterium]
MSINGLLIPLQDNLERVIKVFNQYELNPDFQIITNEDFNSSILIPTMNITGEIADTNELFLRSVQLWKMFEKEPKSINSVEMSNIITPSLPNFHNNSVNHFGESKKREIQIKPGVVMDEKQLIKAIQSIGKGCFVKYYDYFKDRSLSDINIIELMMQKEGYEESGCKIRVYYSRKIINSGYGPKILSEIAQSTKLDYATITKAKELLKKYP